MNIVKAKSNYLSKAIKLLRLGGGVAYPTDTSYGLGVDATSLSAVKKLYRLKGRNFKKPTHIVVSDLMMAKKYARFDKRAEKVFKRFLPGPLTLVLPAKKSRGVWKLLTAGTGKIGIRMPKNRIALDLVRGLGKPMTATSANVSGKNPAYSPIEIYRQFKKRKLKPDLILDYGKLKKVKPSTVLEISQNNVKILRRGPFSLKKIKQAAG